MVSRSRVVLITLAAVTAGCSGSAYTMANVQADLSMYEIVGKGEMDATGLQIASVIPVQNTNKIERAVQRILDDHNGDELINISITESWWWAYVLQGYKVHIEGTVVKRK